MEDIIMSKKHVKLKVADGFEYRMSKEMADVYFKARKGSEELNMHPETYLCKVVNEEFRGKGTCVGVIVG
jgi:hypothetical protein